MEIKDYPNYLIYDDGRVYSKYLKGRFLKPRLNSHGYVQVALYNDNKRKGMLVSRLVALHYIDNPENKLEVDHIDRNRLNNNIENLRWVTHSDNNRNKDITGAIPFRGVSKHRNRFQARIKIDGKLKHLGYYDTPEEASEAYIKYCNDNNIKLY